MKEALMLIGGFTVGCVAVLVALIVVMMVFEAATCARFVCRIRSASIRADARIRNWHLFKAWFRYWIGTDTRPNYLVVIQTNETIYWPGKEGTRRYPA